MEDIPATKKSELSESIKVSPQVKQMLDELKSKDGHTSMDSVIRYLLDITAFVNYVFPKGIWRIKNGDPGREDCNSTENV